MRLRVVAIAIALLASTASVAHAAGFVVAELFTSQGCSSCPPADALLGVMAKDPNIIALGCHVTYWDHESWKDTLAQPFCTARQYAYAKTVKDGVFTPQLIVDGIKSVVGNEPASVLLALHSAPAAACDHRDGGGRHYLRRHAGRGGHLECECPPHQVWRCADASDWRGRE